MAALDAGHPNRLMFTAREFDKETGLYYYRARYYKPEIGRFLQVDPLGYKAGMNLYRYCSNNPWNMIDPFGFQTRNEWPDPLFAGPNDVNIPYDDSNEPTFKTVTTVSVTAGAHWRQLPLSFFPNPFWPPPGDNAASLTLSANTIDGKTFEGPPTVKTAYKSNTTFKESERAPTDVYTGLYFIEEGEVQCFQWAVEFTWTWKMGKPPGWPWILPWPAMWMKSTITVSICANGQTSTNVSNSQSLFGTGVWTPELE